MIAFVCTAAYECLKLNLPRVKDGITDFCVIYEFDVQALCQLLSGDCSPAKPFKPVLDGFEIDFCRKVLTAGE